MLVNVIMITGRIDMIMNNLIIVIRTDAAMIIMIGVIMMVMINLIIKIFRHILNIFLIVYSLINVISLINVTSFVYRRYQLPLPLFLH